MPGFSLWAVHGATDAPVVAFVEDNLRVSPQSINAGGAATVSVDVTNRSNSNATYFASLWVEQQISHTDEFVIGAGETRTVELPLSVDRAGEYEVLLAARAATPGGYRSGAHTYPYSNSDTRPCSDPGAGTGRRHSGAYSGTGIQPAAHTRYHRDSGSHANGGPNCRVPRFPRSYSRSPHPHLS